MALIHRAQLVPSKIEMLRHWVPDQPWTLDVDTAALHVLGAYRFDDPDGEVGVETHVLGADDGRVLQVPVTYRGAPLAGAESALITTMEHSVLGTRWVYDACADPVYATALLTAILTGAAQAELEYANPADAEGREVTTRVRGSGTPGTAVPVLSAVGVTNGRSTTTVRSGGVEVEVVRVIDAGPPPGEAPVLVGTWPGREESALLGTARLR
ncbi:hypothetical protein FK531_01005 [Rhodococcus spelaei]|uniref:Maltokinase N-terminal cap domain-containing protein n=1 Tax=Rhodococcus spelaei TaxID=2546320 RepID=A0A541BQW0_9NOCA|nr:hypothetical protein [Rhodococcus spelaei]TQF74710.1 hypothetical protein FK531_01005 [Rhodococcus spelaei]